MPKTRINYEVEMDDGEVYTVVADQRDLARYEEQEFYDPNHPFITTRYLAWSASQRTDHRISWGNFKEQCVEARDVQKPDPTTADPSADNS